MAQYLRARQDRLIVLAEVQRMMSHPVLGASWEGHVIESLLAVAPAGTVPSFHRSDAGAEIDLLLTWPDGQHWAIEVKRSTTPKVERGFYSACEDIRPSRKWLIYPGADSYTLCGGVEVLPLHTAMQTLAAAV